MLGVKGEHTIGERTAIIVEGHYDALIINALLGRQRIPAYSVTPAGGQLNLPLTALAQFSMRPDTTKIVIVTDGDTRPEMVRDRIRQSLHDATVPSGSIIETVVIDPDLETALGLPKRTRSHPNAREVTEQVGNLDLAALGASEPELRRLFHLLNVSR
ncbi:DUF3226 domain-containing protein [Catelliglobosispora koreensis]|uniref:DUF3226 domain-containing protein n=1 Tax=Catelliglobosispora koreensis TaxID=129052 RepID=UPI00036145FC|nr:DUF3226 domain-containing protein [Catelliglobosispora koreensis]